MASTQLEIILIDGSAAATAAMDSASDSGARPAMPSAVPQGPGRTPSMPAGAPGAASDPKFGDRSSPNYREAGAPISAELAKLQRSVSSILGKTAVGSAVGQAVGVSRQMAQLMEAVQARAQRQGTAGDKMPDDAPRREDFRDLKSAINDLTRRLSTRSERGGLGSPSSGREPRRRRGAPEGSSQESGLSRRERAKIEAQLTETFGDLSKMNPATRASLERELAEKFGFGRKSTPAPIEPPGDVERRTGKPPIVAERVSQRSLPGAPPIDPEQVRLRSQPGPPPVQTTPAIPPAQRTDPQTPLGQLGDRIGRMLQRVEDRTIGAGRRVRSGARRVGAAWRGTAGDVAEGARVLGRRVAGSRVAQGARRAAGTVGRNVGEFAEGIGRTRVGGAVARGGAAIGRGGAAVARRTGMTAAAGSVGRFVAARGATAAATTAVAGGSTAAGAGAAAVLGGPVGIAVGAVALALGALVISVKKASDAFSSVSDKLEDVSPAIASARATAERRSERSRIDRANELGPQLANLEAARGRLDDSLYQLGTDILGVLLKAEPAIETGVDSLAALAQGARVGIAGAADAKAKLTFWDQEDDKKAAVQMLAALTGFNDAMREALNLPPKDAVGGVDEDFKTLLRMRLDVPQRVAGGGDEFIPNPAF